MGGKQKRESVNSREGLTEEKDHATWRKRENAVARNWLALWVEADSRLCMKSLWINYELKENLRHLENAIYGY
jgi:hypothetical protein